MEHSEGYEGNNPSILEIEGPAVLAKGQNFFDQPPFAKVINELHGDTGIPSASLRTMLGHLIQNNVLTDERLKRDITVEQAAKEFVSESRMSELNAIYKFPPGLSKDIVGGVVNNLFRALEEFPYWEEYVANKLAKGIYTYDGTPFPAKYRGKVLPTLSYGEWASVKSQREQRIKGAAVQVVVAEAFPQQFGNQTVEEVIHEQGKSLPSRRWRIVRAANIATAK